MKIIYEFYSEKYGEVGGMFDADGNLLDCWVLNDADWRGEYFNGFMKKIGVEVVRLPKKFEKKALKQIVEEMGLSDYDE